MNSDYDKYYDFRKKGIETAIQTDTNLEMIEDFFSFIDKLEQRENKNKEDTLLLVECYSLIGNLEKATELFSSIYNPKDKRDLKKLFGLKNSANFCVVRPSDRCEELPQFKYVSYNTIKDLFYSKDGVECALCGEKDIPFYGGEAYDEDEDIIAFVHKQEHYCVKCLQNGNMAKKLGIHFNDTYLDGLKGIKEEYRNELIRRTPACGWKFMHYDEEGWPNCCDNFMMFVSDCEMTFEFVCQNCGNTFSIKKE